MHPTITPHPASSSPPVRHSAPTLDPSPDSTRLLRAIMAATDRKPLRIASLLPSTTDICISLGLERHVVGITHECDFPSSSHPLYKSTDPLISHGENDHNNGGASTGCEILAPLTLTVSQIDPHLQSQEEIDAAVKRSVHSGISLYNLNDTALTDARPTIILTQSLCDVCAVAKDDVDEEVACNFRPGHCKVLSLEPESLEEVVETFVTIADACGVKERGSQLSQRFREGGSEVLHATSLTKVERKPRVLFAEWLAPFFDAGHWIPDMLALSGCESALPTQSKSTRKSVGLAWQQVYDSDPDVVVIGCCGFDLKRNEEDARAVMAKLKPLRAFRNNRIYASDGNLYFARPGPGLREGMAILARCAYDGENDVVEALERLPFMPKENAGWSKVVFPEESSFQSDVPDVEDLVDENFFELHKEACLAKQDFYQDPKTGYQVFTEHAHLKRGKCCGGGCRHCPYNHANVKDKAARIQQPAFLYEGEHSAEASFFAPVSSIPDGSHVKILFFSGGKDSFLTIRRLVKQRQVASTTFQLILLTTFDNESRMIAHQDMHIDVVVRQAKHLGIPLLGIPLRRGSGESYLSRIEKGLDVICQKIPSKCQMSLAFGDLHLDHIREWREKELSKNYSLEYPIWKVPYDDLMADLEASGVNVILTAVTVSEERLKVGMPFTRELWKDAVNMGMDGFGENGEWHSQAEVWTVSRKRALGLS